MSVRVMCYGSCLGVGHVVVCTQCQCVVSLDTCMLMWVMLMWVMLSCGSQINLRSCEKVILS